MLTAHNIENEFLAPLAEPFGEMKNPDAIAKELAKVKATLTADDLRQCAEQVKRAHKGKTMPSLFHLRRALADYVRPDSSKAFGSVGELCPADEYFKRVKAWANLNGGLVLIEREKRTVWRAWQRYYQAIGKPKLASIMETVSSFAVASVWPWDFDGAYRRPADWDHWPEPVVLSEAERAEIVARVLRKRRVAAPVVQEAAE